MSDSYLKATIDAAAHSLARGDDSLSTYARFLLVSTIREVYELRYPQLPWADGTLMEFNFNIDPGAREVGFFQEGARGRAAIVADGAKDYPLIGLEGRWTPSPAHTLGCAVQWTDQDILQSRMMGIGDIASRKARAARRGHDEELNRLIRDGSTPENIKGITALPGAYDVTVPAGTEAWTTTATPTQIRSGFTKAWQTVLNGSGGTLNVNTAVIALSLWPRIAVDQNSVADSKTILDYLKAAFPMIDRWIYDVGLDTAGVGGGPCVMMYNRDRDYLNAQMPERLKPSQLRPVGPFTWELAFKSRYAGIASIQPKAVARLSGMS